MYKFLSLLIFILVFFLSPLFSCTNPTYAGDIEPNQCHQYIDSVYAGLYYSFFLEENQIVVFSFCESGAYYENDPLIEIFDNTGTVSLGFNDDHCGNGSELVFLSPVTGIFRFAAFQGNCLADSTFLGKVSYRIVPDPTIQDCLGATTLCSLFVEVDSIPTGTGNYYDIYNFNELDTMPVNANNCPNCLVAGERNSLWYRFTVYNSGYLDFVLAPELYAVVKNMF